MSRIRLLLTALFAATVLLLAACSADGDDATDGPSTEETTPADDEDGGDDDGEVDDDGDSGEVHGTADEYVDALVDGVDLDQAVVPFDEEQLTCVARGIVDHVGAERYGEAGVAPSDLTFTGPFPPEIDVEQSEVEDVHDIIDGCGIEQHTALRDFIVAEAPEEGMIECFDDIVGEDEARDIMANLLGFPLDSAEEIFAELEACSDLIEGDGATPAD